MKEAMNDSHIIDNASILRKQANRLLNDEGLLTMLQDFGETRVIGSYTLDTMTWRDIDISMMLPDGKDVTLFFRIGKRIARKFQITKMSFSNHYIRDFPGFDHGLYWGIKLLFAEQEWKVDLWGYGETDYQKHMVEFDDLQKQLQKADREAILRIKYVISQHPEYRGDVYNSMKVYQAVIEDEITSVEEFNLWIKRKGHVNC